MDEEAQLKIVVRVIDRLKNGSAICDVSVEFIPGSPVFRGFGIMKVQKSGSISVLNDNGVFVCNLPTPYNDVVFGPKKSRPWITLGTSMNLGTGRLYGSLEALRNFRRSLSGTGRKVIRLSIV